MLKPRALPLLLSSLLVASACLGPEPEGGDGLEGAALAGDDTRSDALVWASTRTLWTNNLNVIPVCWIQPGFDTEKEIIRQAVLRAWGTAAQLAFSGWGPCPNDDSLRIRLSTEPVFPEGPPGGFAYDSDVGMEARRGRTGASIRFLLWPFYDRTMKRRIEWNAVSRFGHLLGFLDESQTPAQAPNCSTSTYPPDAGGAIQLGTYDPDSVMSGCRSIQDPTELSAKDKKAVQQVYGPESRTNVAAIVSGTNERHVFARGTDGALWWNSPNNVWSSPFGATNGTPSVLWYSAIDRVDVFSRDANNALRMWTYASGSWSAWANLGGVFTEDVKAVAWAPNRIDVFGKGTDRKVYTRSFVNGVWTSVWASLGGPIDGRLEVISRGPGIIDLFALGTDGAIYRKTLQGTTWSPSGESWQVVSSQVYAEPFAVESYAGIDLFHRGTDGQLRHRRWTRATQEWLPRGLQPAGDWTVIPGIVTGDPAPIRNGNQVLVFARGPQLSLKQATLNGSGVWSAWTDRGGRLLGSPRAVLSHNATVWARGTDDSVNFFNYTTAAWTGLGGRMGW